MSDIAELRRLLADEEIVRAREFRKTVIWSCPDWATALADLAERIEARITEIEENQ